MRTASTYKWDQPGDDERREYIGQSCTLNGQPAKIVHTGDGWAGVAPLNPEFGTVPYSWAAIYNVMHNHGGNFSAY